MKSMINADKNLETSEINSLNLQPGSQASIEISYKIQTFGYAYLVHYTVLFHNWGYNYNSLILPLVLDRLSACFGQNTQSAFHRLLNLSNLASKRHSIYITLHDFMRSVAGTTVANILFNQGRTLHTRECCTFCPATLSKVR